MNVLLVEDEKVNRLILVSILSRLVVTIREANDGLEALGLVEEQAPDLLITDLSMPRLDGLGLLEELHLRGRHFKTIVLTAHNEASVLERAHSLETCRVLFKPLRVNLLTQAIEEVAAELGLARIP